MWKILLSFLLLIFMASCAEVSQDGASGGVVVLDIGHFIGAEGASTPSAINGQRIHECSFWYRYAYYVKRVVEKAGYRCVIINRGNAPTSEPLASYASRANVVQLNRPDSNGARYPSTYFPDRVASGIVSADYAIRQKASCAVFLHHNSTGRKWTTAKGSPSIIICNKHNGRTLAESLCHVLNNKILNHVMPNGGRQCTIEVRSVDADRSAGWMNACDDAGIPAAVIEAAFLNNRSHADFLAQDANARIYAQAIGLGIVRFLKEHGNDPRHVRENPDEPDEGSFGYAKESRSLNVPGAKRLLH